jgi:hypothetical protein
MVCWLAVMDALVKRCADLGPQPPPHDVREGATPA